MEMKPLKIKHGEHEGCSIQVTKDRQFEFICKSEWLEDGEDLFSSYIDGNPENLGSVLNWLAYITTDWLKEDDLYFDKLREAVDSLDKQIQSDHSSNAEIKVKEKKQMAKKAKKAAPKKAKK